MSDQAMESRAALQIGEVGRDGREGPPTESDPDLWMGDYFSSRIGITAIIVMCVTDCAVPAAVARLTRR